jgi:TRAP-type C4-dicarboxylate transport system permease small subunit
MEGPLNKTLAVICTALLGGIFGSVLLQVLMRYVFNSPLTWSDEVTRLFLVWLTFLGAVLSYRLGTQIAVDAFQLLAVRLDWHRLAQSAEVLIQTTIALVSLALLLGGIQLTDATLDRPTPALGIPVATFYLAVPVSAGLILWSIAERVVESFKRRKGAR